MTNLTYLKYKPENVRQIQRITFFSIVVNLLLSAIKFVVGTIGCSNVVVADAVHSLSDSATDAVILFGVKIWSAPPDQKHPYGHLRIETLVSAIIGFFLIVVAIGIGYEAVATLNVPKPISLSSLWVALTGPAISIVAKEFMFRWNINVGGRIKSSALVANAWHHRTDVISSVAAVLAICAILVDPRLYFMDNIGALIVAVFIFRVAWNILAPAFSELTDSGASEKIQGQIHEIASNVAGVKEAHAIRTRKTGSNVCADLHILVDGNMSVYKSHTISEKIQHELMQKIPEIIDVIVHIEPFE